MIKPSSRAPRRKTLLLFERKFGLSEIVAFAALAASVYAVFQSREANSPRIDIASLPARSYVVCDKETGMFNARNVVLFRISNNGGRGATFVGFSPLEGTEPVSVVAAGQTVKKPWYQLQVLDKLEAQPNGLDSPSWELEPIFIKSKQLVLREKEGGNIRARPTLFDVPLEPGKAKVLAIGFTTRNSEGGQPVERLRLSLLGHFTDGEALVMQASTELPALERGLCGG